MGLLFLAPSWGRCPWRERIPRPQRDIKKKFFFIAVHFIALSGEGSPFCNGRIVHNITKKKGGSGVGAVLPHPGAGENRGPEMDPRPNFFFLQGQAGASIGANFLFLVHGPPETSYFPLPIPVGNDGNPFAVPRHWNGRECPPKVPGYLGPRLGRGLYPGTIGQCLRNLP